MRDPDCIAFSLRLRDRYADHGLVGVMIAFIEGRTVRIDTWLMSCRVLGRNVEAHMLRHLSIAAVRRDCRTIEGSYIPTAKNGLVKDLYSGFGFVEAGAGENGTAWSYDLAREGVIEASGIVVTEERNSFDDATSETGATV
jgi:predicted enzyme involved in methoxymalonyl-ACP biosynthesis